MDRPHVATESTWGWGGVGWGWVGVGVGVWGWRGGWRGGWARFLTKGHETDAILTFIK